MEGLQKYNSSEDFIAALSGDMSSKDVVVDYLLTKVQSYLDKGALKENSYFEVTKVEGAKYEIAIQSPCIQHPDARIKMLRYLRTDMSDEIKITIRFLTG